MFKKLTIFKSISFPVIHRLLVFTRHSSRFTASSVVKFLCFITLSNILSHLTSPRPRRRLPSGDHVIILLCHLLSSQCTTFRTISTCFTVLPKLSVLPVLLLWWHHCLRLVLCSYLQLFHKNPFLCSTVSPPPPLTCNPVSKFTHRYFKCFLYLYAILFSLYSTKYIYCTAG